MSHPLPGRVLTTPRSTAPPRHVTGRIRGATPPPMSRTLRAATPNSASGNWAIPRRPEPVPVVLATPKFRHGTPRGKSAPDPSTAPVLPQDDEFDTDDPAFMEGYAPPPHAVAFDEMLQNRKDFMNKCFEAARVKTRAERDQLMDPNLAKTAHDSLETLNSGLEAFYASEAFKNLVKSKDKPSPSQVKSKSESDGIPCPMEARADLIEAFKSLGQMNQILKANLMKEVDTETISSFVGETTTNLDKKLQATKDHLDEKTRKNIGDGKSLVQGLTKAHEKKETIQAKKAKNKKREEMRNKK